MKSIVNALLVGLLVIALIRMGERHLTPTPKPDVPVVAPPIAGGNALLIVYDATQVLPAAQQGVLNSPALRTWAKNHNAELRVWDVRTQIVTAGDQRFAVPLGRPRTSLPWLYGSLGKQGLDRPLPASVAETLQALEEIAR